MVRVKNVERCTDKTKKCEIAPHGATVAFMITDTDRKKHYFCKMDAKDYFNNHPPIPKRDDLYKLITE
jgi:hypothetical protein